jgi:hypothetical protein
MEHVWAHHYGASVRAVDYATPITYSEIEDTVYGDDITAVGWSDHVWDVIAMYCNEGWDLRDQVGYVQSELLRHGFGY